MTNLENLEFASRYPTEGVMRDGTSILFTPLKSEDREQLESLIKALPSEDLLYLRQDITDASVIDTWITSVESGQVFTVLASVGARVVGYASLHIDAAVWSRHVGEIRINVHPDYRGTGLGAALAGEIRFVAPTFGIRKLIANMPLEQHTAMIVFERLGFQLQTILRGWVTDMHGEERDLLVMALTLPKS
tara:strand:- start:8491 stop:9060 length:570 start_codon:yes stop_codon:yes gene_type:complete